MNEEINSRGKSSEINESDLKELDNNWSELLQKTADFGQANRLTINGFAITLLGILLFSRIADLSKWLVVVLSLALSLCVIAVILQLWLGEVNFKMVRAAREDFMRTRNLRERDLYTKELVGFETREGDADSYGQVGEKIDGWITGLTMFSLTWIFIAVITYALGYSGLVCRIN